MASEFKDLSDNELMIIGNKMMDQLMAASTRIDYQAHVHHFSNRVKSMISEAQFNAMCAAYQKNFGIFTKRKFVAVFRRPDSIAFVWKQNYSQVEGDYVAEMVMIIEDDTYKVDHAVVF